MRNNLWILFFLMLIVSCSQESLFVSDPHLEELYGSTRPVRIKAFLKGHPTAFLLPENIESLQETLLNSSFKRVVLTPYYWNDRTLIINNNPDIDFLWLNRAVTEDYPSIYTRWDWSENDEAQVLLEALKDSSVLMISAEDNLSKTMADAMESLLENTVTQWDHHRVKEENWRIILGNQEMETIEYIIIYCGTMTPEVLNYLKKWEIPLGGEIPQVQDINWFFQTSSNWDELLLTAFDSMDDEFPLESKEIMPFIRVNRVNLRRKSIAQDL